MFFLQILEPFLTDGDFADMILASIDIARDFMIGYETISKEKQLLLFEGFFPIFATHFPDDLRAEHILTYMSLTGRSCNFSVVSTLTGKIFDEIKGLEERIYKGDRIALTG